MNEQILGRGLAFPMQLGVAGLAQASGVAKVEQSIRIILGTQHGERVMRPLFGSNLRTLVFAPNNASTANLARYYVTEALARWEPRIDVLDVVVTNDNRQRHVAHRRQLPAARHRRRAQPGLPASPWRVPR